MIRFLQPWWLLAVLPVLLVAGAYVLAAVPPPDVRDEVHQRGPAAHARAQGTGLAAARRGRAFLLSLLSLALALARPSIDREEPLERATVMLAIDVSLSMEADDVAPNRIEAAQEAAKAFVRSCRRPTTWGWSRSPSRRTCWSRRPRTAPR